MTTVEVPALAGLNPSSARLSHRPANRIDDLINEVDSLRAVQRDIRVNTRELAIAPADGALMVGGGERYPLRDHAFAQLCSRLKVPAPYARRCDSGLRAQNLNRWLNEEDRNVLLRLERGEVRAVLSASYRAINHADILGWLADRLGVDTPIRYELTEGYLDMQVIRESPVQSLSDRGRQGLHRGIHLRNSEVGTARVRISTLVFRSICLNGLILNGGSWSYSRRHVGKADIASDVREAFDRAMALAGKAAEGLLETEGVEVADPLKVFDRIVTRYELSEGEDSAIRKAFLWEPGHTLWHVVNSLTRAGNANDLPLDSRHRLQELGGRITSLASEGRRWLDN
ncbi:MAG: hypothetical protein K8I27_01345 [Planctomycetes bacterium]|nr:hypothetical protein [Planctomycetota bacterium]